MERGRAVYLTYTGLGRALAALPEPMALGAGRAVGSFLHRIEPAQRAAISRNLRRVLGPDVAESEVDRWVARAFASYARYWVEGARLGGTSPTQIRQHFVVEDGFAYLKEGVKAGRGVVVALPHVGSWDYGGAFLAAVGYPMTVVAERIKPEALFEHFVAERAAMGLTVIPLDEGSGSAVLKTLRKGGLVGLIAERDLTGTGVAVRFFGEETTMPAGPATVALRTGATLLTAAVYSGPGRQHHAVIEAPIDLTRTRSFRADVHRITQELAIRFEGLIRRAPEQWHAFQPVWPGDRHASPVEEVAR